MAEPTNDGIDGEVLPPEGGASVPATTGKGKGAHRTFGRSSNQNEKQRKEEEDRAAPFGKALLRGLDWRQPGWEPDDDERHMVAMLKFSGYTDEDVARVLGMSVETMLKYFQWEIANARMMIIGDLATRAVVRARQGDATLTMFLLKTRSDQLFSERVASAAALGDALGKDEPDDKKRAELVGRVLDLLDSTRKTKTAATAETKKGTTKT